MLSCIISSAVKNYTKSDWHKQHLWDFYWWLEESLDVEIPRQTAQTVKYTYIPSIVIVIITTIGYHNHNARVPPELLVETHSFPFSGHKLASQLSCSPTVARRAPSSFQWAAAWARWGELQSLVWQRNSERSKQTLLVPEGKHKLTQTWPKSLFDAKRWLEDELLDQMWTDVEERHGWTRVSK